MARARLAILVGTLVAGALVLQSGVTQILGKRDPVLASKVAPGNARIALAAARAAMADGKVPSDPEIRALTARALRRDATLTPAIEFRALDAADSGDRSRAARLFTLSDAISRRSLSTRVWFVQSAVERGKVHVALENMDIALRTSSAAPPLIFPALARAIADPALVAPIARLLDRPSDWRVMFLNFVVEKADGSAAAALLLRMREQRVIADSGIDRKLIGRLTSERNFALARRIEDSFNPSGRPRPLLADGNFASSSARYPFAWGLIEGSAIGAVMSEVSGRSALAYRADPAQAGQVAAQLMMLTPGRYRLRTTTAEAGDPVAPPFWTLNCAERDGGQITSLDQPARNGGSSAVQFTVPPYCRAQWLTLRLRPSLIGTGQEGAIASVSVEALQARSHQAKPAEQRNAERPRP